MPHPINLRINHSPPGTAIFSNHWKKVEYFGCNFPNLGNNSSNHWKRPLPVATVAATRIVKALGKAALFEKTGFQRFELLIEQIVRLMD